MSRRPIPTPGAQPHTTSTRDGDDWRHRAACIGEDGDLFFAPDGERSDARIPRVIKARRICAACPVQQECRDEATTQKIPYGVWGGLDEAERRTPRRGRRAQRPNRVRDECGTSRGITVHRNHGEKNCRACLDYDNNRRIAKFTATYGDAAALALDGYTLNEAAAALGCAAETLARTLRATDQYPVLTRLRRNPGRDATQAA